MKTNKISTLVLITAMIISLILSACGNDDNESVTETAPETKTITESESETESETEPETERETETESESETEKETEESKEEADDSEETCSSIFFGKKLDLKIAEINERTLANENSGLYDIMSAPETISGEEVKYLIEAYTFPEKEYLNGVPVTEDMISALQSYRNLEGISEEVTIEYAICVQNGSIRAFPTSELLTDTEDMSGFDYLQETGLNYACGVLVYHKTSDGAYAFVQAENYRGWIRSEEIAYTDRETFLSFLAPENFLVSVIPGTSQDGIDRMGVIIPYAEKNETDDGVQYTAEIPLRNEDGTLKIGEETVTVGSDETYHEGFLEYSVENLLELTESTLGTKYGWGDMNNGYDCSSMVGAIYKCFGIYCPRNTSQLPELGVTVINTEELTNDEKFELIKDHPGCIVRMNGHAGIGLENGEVIHNNTVFRNEAGGIPVENWCCVQSDFRENFDANGLTFMERVKNIIFVE